MTQEEMEALISRYTTRPTTVERGPGLWNTLKVEILLDGQKIGEYDRDYPELIDTFVPFVQAGQLYALYSPFYTGTRLMRLPECEDIGGEERQTEGFCPAGYYVPYIPDKGLVAEWGFICGCVWGDDASWKIQYLDLSDASRGILRREARFGYLEMASRLSLKESINFEFYSKGDGYDEIEFITRRLFSMAQGKFIEDGYDHD